MKSSRATEEHTRRHYAGGLALLCAFVGFLMMLASAVSNIASWLPPLAAWGFKLTVFGLLWIGLMLAYEKWYE